MTIPPTSSNRQQTKQEQRHCQVTFVAFWHYASTLTTKKCDRGKKICNTCSPIFGPSGRKARQLVSTVMHAAEAELTDPIRAGQTALTQLTRLWQTWGQFLTNNINQKSMML